MEELLQQILATVNRLETNQERFEERQIKFETRLITVEHKLDLIYDQTAILTEFRDETLQKFDQMAEVQDQILYDIELLAGEQGKQKLEIERLKLRPV